MKQYLIRPMTAAFVILIAASGAMAQAKKSDTYKFNQKRTFEALDMCLHKSDVPGFVESALYTVAECKNRYPALNYSQLLGSVRNVEENNSNPSIRYKAYLVSMYLTHGANMEVTTIKDANNHEYLFKQIAEQLEQKYLAFNSDNNVAENR